MNRWLVFAAVPVVVLNLLSCAQNQSPIREPVTFQPTGKDLWSARTGSFDVDLILGEVKHDAPVPDGEWPPAPSTYRVTYHGPAGERRIDTESRYTAHYLNDEDQYLLGSKPGQLVVSDRGDALVIDEMIPNDCCAANNYTYIAPDSQGKLTRIYFELPGKPTKDIEMPDLPRVTGIGVHVIRYRYHSGEIGSTRIAKLKKLKTPVQPG